MARNLRVEYIREKCIGNGACVKISEDFTFDSENKAQLRGSNRQGDTFVVTKTFNNPKIIVEAAESCPVNAIRVLDSDTNEEVVSSAINEDKMQEILASYDDLKEFVMDPKGYFLIRVDPDKKRLEVAFCPEVNKITVKIVGAKPLDVYQTIIKQGLITRLDHAAYLGRELQKAYIALTNNLAYIQDDELNIQ
jgi:ferredoxin